jgi:hypothetical protein
MGNSNGRKGRGLDIAELKNHADIRQVWAALGGRPLRHQRGQAWWRGGDGFNVALYPDKDTWHDFVANEGGDAIALVRQCSFLEACEWLADFTGVRVSKWIRKGDAPDTDWPTDLKWATWWRIAVEAMAQDSLERLPYWDRQRRPITDLLSTIRLGDAALVNEYRAWRQRWPALTSAMAKAASVPMRECSAAWRTGSRAGPDPCLRIRIAKFVSRPRHKRF